ncbi:hypothetical protein ACFFX0_02660 [Citricoccus parietis]|uniref:Uncharacterized protein n=1 Tax=Citricoccus parietis TaxID=592307 RepID=A0ABV5FTY9_9MICC
MPSATRSPNARAPARGRTSPAGVPASRCPPTCRRSARSKPAWSMTSPNTCGSTRTLHPFNPSPFTPSPFTPRPVSRPPEVSRPASGVRGGNWTSFSGCRGCERRCSSWPRGRGSPLG